jgi:hypothetical protein
MSPVYWIGWSSICAAGAGILVYFIMQSRMEVILSRQREALSKARAALRAQKKALGTTHMYIEELAKRKALDEFLTEIRVEERHYVLERQASMVPRKSLIRQERIFFRNIPLSSWVEHEMPFEEGTDLAKLTQDRSVFPSEDFGDVVKLLR